MNILEAFDIRPDKKESLCFVGAGGKTSAMFAVAEALKALGKSVILTTTTHIWYPNENQCDAIIVSENKEDILKAVKSIRASEVYIVGSRKTSEDKLRGIAPEWIDTIFHRDAADFILTECDGSRQKPVKAPAAHEPVIPHSASAVIGVIGLDCIGKTVNTENIHRLEEFCQICGCAPGDIITEKEITKLVLHPKGLFKSVSSGVRRYVLLNKAENEKRVDAARIIKKATEDTADYTVRISILLKETIILQ